MLRLKPHEVETLELIAAGLSPKEVGEKMFVSRDGIEQRLYTMRKNFNAKNTVHLMAIAITNKLIFVEENATSSAKVERLLALNNTRVGIIELLTKLKKHL